VLSFLSSALTAWHDRGVTETQSAPRTARERARAEITAEILASARRQMATSGAASISLRAVARDLGMVSSAVYRYFASRDELLTRLIIEAYNSLGDEVDAAEAAQARDDYLGRWMAVAHAIRNWALAHPHEWALIYGSPVPGYAAPEDTVGPGTRSSTTMLRILVEALLAGVLPPSEEVPRKVSRSMKNLKAFIPVPVPDSYLVVGLMARTQVFGHVTLELDGQFDATIDDPTTFFDHVARTTARQMGLPG
jgi:AcrR family transcriptional regulator